MHHRASINGSITQIVVIVLALLTTITTSVSLQGFCALGTHFTTNEVQIYVYNNNCNTLNTIFTARIASSVDAKSRLPNIINAGNLVADDAPTFRYLGERYGGKDEPKDC
ncbi:hypothetical protein BJ878DRAFT_485920 [Calycina marina]|uniref:Uncharacterized protein n=1 Tax=Calycina marina TaxID=1763456 RepID=A0A9P7ZB85_9HELO|nr:hypothetical protein BJ878DRAFT_485920 [Calycina marina]